MIEFISIEREKNKLLNESYSLDYGIKEEFWDYLNYLVKILLNKNQQAVFSLWARGYTYDEIALETDRTKQRIWQILQKSLRIIRSNDCRHLLEYLQELEAPDYEDKTLVLTEHKDYKILKNLKIF